MRSKKTYKAQKTEEAKTKLFVKRMSRSNEKNEQIEKEMNMQEIISQSRK